MALTSLMETRRAVHHRAHESLDSCKSPVENVKERLFLPILNIYIRLATKIILLNEDVAIE